MKIGGTTFDLEGEQTNDRLGQSVNGIESRDRENGETIVITRMEGKMLKRNRGYRDTYLSRSTQP